MTLTNLTVTKPIRLVAKGDPSTMIVNRDIVNQVAYGDQGITGLNLNEYSIIDPLGTVTVDGSQDVWALPVSGSPMVDVVPGSTGWVASPAQVAAQIQALGLATAANQGTQITQGGTLVTNTGSTVTNTSNTNTSVQGLTIGGNPGGIPLLRGANNLGAATNQTIVGAGSATILNSVAVAQPSYEASFSASYPASSGTIPFIRVQFQWINAATGLIADIETFYMPGGNAPANAITCYASGPCRGTALTIVVTNFDPSITVTVSYDVNQTSHIYERDRFFQPSYAGTAPNGFVNPDGFPTTGTIVATNPTIGASGVITRLLAVWSGRVLFAADNSSSTGGAVLFLFHDPGKLYQGVTNQLAIMRIDVAANAKVVQELSLPNGPILLGMQNSSTTTSITPVATFTKIEY